MIFENIFYVIFCLAILKPCYSAQVAAPLEAFKDKVLPIAPTTLTRPRYQNLAFSIAILYNFPHIRRYIMEKADDVGLNFYLAHCFYLFEAGYSLGRYHLDNVGYYLEWKGHPLSNVYWSLLKATGLCDSPEGQTILIAIKVAARTFIRIDEDKLDLKIPFVQPKDLSADNIDSSIQNLLMSDEVSQRLEVHYTYDSITVESVTPSKYVLWLYDTKQVDIHLKYICHLFLPLF